MPAQLAGLDDRTRGLVQELTYGTVRWFPRINAWIAHLVPRRPTDAYVVALLAVGLYQIGFTRIPAHAAVSETVAAAPAKLRGLCNAVLRNAQRNRAQLEALSSDSVVATAHPRWLLEALQTDWPDAWPDIVKANNSQAPMTLRVNRRLSSRDEYMAQLAQAGIASRAAVHATDGVILEQAMSVSRLPGFSEGMVSVQDGAAQLAADVVDAQAGMRVLDACAAPGGKACHLLERTPDLATLVALDIDAARMHRIEENLQRLRLDAVLLVGDAADPSSWWDGTPFDRILLDAPCSATGVIRRHPDIRLLRRPSDIKALAQRQAAMVAALWPLLSPGGRLVYATCSVLKAENDAITAGWPTTPIIAEWGHPTEGGRQVLPGEDDMDGFHYACLLKETA